MKRVTVSERALVLAPRGRDAAIAVAVLREGDIEAEVCPTLPGLLAALDEGTGFVVVTEEAISGADLHPLVDWLNDQQEWSDLPFVLLTRSGGGIERNPAARRYLDVLGNVVFLERPFHPTTLLSLARSALRSRRRQYDARTRLEALRESETHYRNLFETMDEGFCTIRFVEGPDGSLADFVHVTANPAYQRHAGIRNVVGRTARDILGDEADGWIATFRKVLLTGEPVRFERELVSTGRYLEIASFRVGPKSRREVAVVFQDVSERKRAEKRLRELNETLEKRVDAAVSERGVVLAQLHEAQKLETIGQLTGGVAHDINNLLTPITGALDLLNRRYAKADPRSARLLDGALQSAERAKILVNRLLGFARRQTLETRPVDVTSLLEGMRDLVASSVGPAIEVRMAPGRDLPSARADPNQLELAILNLCVNARDAMADGGVLTIAAEQTTISSRPPGDLAPGGYVKISVVDTGAGMDEATLARAVEPFFSTKGVGKGTGLGLSMVHGLAGQLGGAFCLDSTVGAGTRADLYLPIANGPATSTSLGRAAPLASMRPLSLLLVDDEELVRSGTAEMLRELGHEVHEAAGGSQALMRLASGLVVDAVITDYMMPSMSGAELARRLGEEHPGLPVIVVTGYAGGDLDLGLPQLAKPFRQIDLAAALERLIGEADALPRQPHPPGPPTAP